MTSHARARGVPSGPRTICRGTTLVELLVTLPLLAIIGTLAVALLLGAHRQARGSDARERTSRELRHAALVLAAELRPLRSVDLVAWTDTSFDFDVLVGAGIACGTRGTLRAIHLLPAQRDDPAGTAWIASPETLDDVTAWQLAPEPSAPAALVRHTLDRVTPASTCAVSPLQGSTGLGVTLVLRDSLSRQVEEGTPVRVLRRTRYALYRSSDGFWYLGRRSRDGGTWTVIQPVVGPLLSAAAGGVSFSVSDEAGSRLASGGAGAVAMHVGLRAVRGESGARPESTHVEIALRGHHEP